MKLTIDRGTGEVVAKRADIEPVLPATGGAPGLSRMVRRYARRVAPLGRRVVGRASRGLTRKRGAGPGDLGDVAADAQRSLARTDAAFVDQTNMREDVTEGDVTYEDVALTHGYESQVMRFELPGSAIRELVEKQLSDEPGEFLYSSGLRVEPGRIALADGRTLRPDRTYSVAANELLVTGDRFPAFGLRTGGLRRMGTDREALAKWFSGRCGVGGTGLEPVTPCL